MPSLFLDGTSPASGKITVANYLIVAPTCQPPARTTTYKCPENTRSVLKEVTNVDQGNFASS